MHTVLYFDQIWKPYGKLSQRPYTMHKSNANNTMKLLNYIKK